MEEMRQEEKALTPVDDLIQPVLNGRGALAQRLKTPPKSQEAQVDFTQLTEAMRRGQAFTQNGKVYLKDQAIGTSYIHLNQMNPEKCHRCKKIELLGFFPEMAKNCWKVVGVTLNIADLFKVGKHLAEQGYNSKFGLDRRFETFGCWKFFAYFEDYSKSKEAEGDISEFANSQGFNVDIHIQRGCHSTMKIFGDPANWDEIEGVTDIDSCEVIYENVKDEARAPVYNFKIIEEMCNFAYSIGDNSLPLIEERRRMVRRW